MYGVNALPLPLLYQGDIYYGNITWVIPSWGIFKSTCKKNDFDKYADC